MEEIFTLEKLEAMEIPRLRELAVLKSSNSHRFKKTVHGKNKKSVIDFLLKCETNPVVKSDLFLRLNKLSKEELVNHCNKYTDYKKSYERKCKEFQVEFLITKKFDFDDTEVSPEVLKLKKLMSFKKMDLVNHLRKKEMYKPSFERKDKEEIAKMLLNEDLEEIKQVDQSVDPGTSLDKKTLKELKALVANHPVYNPKTHGKTKNHLVHFLQNNKPETTDEEGDDAEESGVTSPINVLDFMVKPDPQLIRDALTKILTSSKHNIV